MLILFTTLCSLIGGWKCFGLMCIRHRQGRIEPSWEVTVYIEVGEGWVWLVMAGDGESRTGREKDQLLQDRSSEIHSSEDHRT